MRAAAFLTEPIRYPPAVLDRVRRLAEAGGRREACGLVARGPAGWEVVALPNAAAGADAFEVEPRALLAALRAIEGRGGAVLAFWHSHVDAPAALSQRDRAAAATADGEPLWPGVEHLVVAVAMGRAADVARYRFERGGLVASPLDASAD
ncbi:MAG TPA: Mov34/MPN/PAD-1 family protein [Anaeromyxobacteraceae bacterium]|nr:Mov34/MPN/PAD-1 family protein [Anaeromyxobacteraceae bacterium]